MFRGIYLFALCGLLLPFTNLAAQDEPPLEPLVSEDLRNLPLDVDRLKRHAVLQYKLHGYRARNVRLGSIRTFEFGPVHVGTVVLNTRVYPTGVTMEDSNWNWSGEFFAGRVGHVYRRDLLDLHRYVRSRCRDHCDCVFDDGRFLCRRNEAECAGDWPEHVLTPAALLRIVMLLPREPGRAYTVPFWSEDSCCGMVGEASHAIVCEGPEQIAVCGVPTDCTRYAFGPTQLWVRNADDRLVRVVRENWFRLELACCRENFPPLAPAPPAEAGEPTPAQPRPE